MIHKRRYYFGNSGRYQRKLHRSGVILLPFSVVMILASFMLLGHGDISIFAGLVNDVGMLLLILSVLGGITGIGCLVACFLEPDVAVFELPEMHGKSAKLAHKIRRLFSDSRLVEILKVAPKTSWGYELPTVYVYVDDDLMAGYILIENLGVYSSLDKAGLSESISGLLSGRKLSSFEVVRSQLTAGGQFVRFDFEDLINDSGVTVYGDDLTPFVRSNKHDIQVAPDAIWHARKYPMMSIIARTGSGKSVLAGRYIARLAKLQGWQVSYNSAKLDNFVREFSGESTPAGIVEQAESYVEIMRRRLAQVADARKSDYAGINLPDILLVFDELGHLNDELADDKGLKKRWETALKSLSMTGRSAGIHLLLISQFGTIDAFVTSSVRAQVSDNVIMLGNAAGEAKERTYVMGGYADIPKRAYKIGEGLAIISGSGRKWEEPHFYKAPWFEGA